MGMGPGPAYLELYRSGALSERVADAYERLWSCDLCARRCRANRHDGDVGECRTGEQAVVSSYHAHSGEEAPLVGTRGSGTIFFGWCNLHCVYCQNYDISQGGVGRAVEAEEIAAMMLDLQEHGCHNINFVSPSHVVPQILASVFIAAEAGLRLPLIYNTGGYESLQTLGLLDGVIDIYMPDMKYADEPAGHKYSGVRDYPAVNQSAVAEMYRQVGDLWLDERGVAQRGILVRHLVLPGGLAGTAKTAKFLAEEVSLNTYVNVMDQFRPTYRASEYPELDRRISRSEYDRAVTEMSAAGLLRLDMRRSNRGSLTW